MDGDAVPSTTPTAPDTSRRKKRWSDFSPGQQRAIVLGAFTELVLTTIAVRDLARRPPRQVRGRKPVWALSFVVQPFGPILYLLAGRRSAAN